MILQNAKLSFKTSGTPVAETFDDVYFSDGQGIAETEYVFIQQNQLPERWLNWSERHFHIMETGFGTGLNFLVLAHYFHTFRQQYPQHDLQHLHFSSCEKFPIELGDLRKIYALLPDQYQHLAAQIIAQYPLSIRGTHRLSLANITLDLHFGDVHDILPDLHTEKTGRFDCWFLDGFAPSKNPEMWQASLFKQMQRLSRPAATFATFTAAGFVKRGLQHAGFTVHKVAGFGHKRDMLCGVVSQVPIQRGQRPYYNRDQASHLSEINLVGGGIASACLAQKLCQRGYQVNLYCQDHELAQEASGNWSAGFYPQLNAEASINAQIQLSSFLYARRYYDRLVAQGMTFDHAWHGVLQLGFNATVCARQKQLSDNACYPPAVIHAIDAQQASQLAGIDIQLPALHIPLGGWLNPSSLVQGLIQQANQTGRLQVHLNRLINLADCSTEQVWIFCMGHHSPALQTLAPLPYRLVRGQVELIASQGELSNLRTVLCHKGYFTPAYEGQHALGSTYVKNDMSSAVNETETAQNISTHRQALQGHSWLDELSVTNSRASVRCSTPDHLPLVGALPNIAQQQNDLADLYKALPVKHYPVGANHPNKFILTGLGSRGFTTAPLMAELLISQIEGRALPLDATLANALNPNRFLLRNLIRRQPYQVD